MKRKVAIAVVSTSMLVGMLSSAAYAEPEGLYYAGKYYSKDYIGSMAENAAFQKNIIAKVVKDKKAYYVLDDKDSFVPASGYDFENGELKEDVEPAKLSEQAKGIPLAASYTNANSKEKLKKVYTDQIKSAAVAKDNKSFSLTLNKTMGSVATGDITVLDEESGKVLKASKVLKDSKDKKGLTYTVSFNSALAAGKSYIVLYKGTDTGVSVTAVTPDKEAPVVKVSDELQNGATVNDAALTFGVDVSDNVDQGLVPVVKLNAKVVAAVDGMYSVTLKEGANTITVDAADKTGNKAKTQTFKVTYSKTAVVIDSIGAVPDVNAKVGDAKVVLPAKVTVTMSDGTTKDVAVTWGTVDTSKAGTVTVEGTVEGTNKKASVKVVVSDVVATIASINAVADVSAKVGDATVALPAKVTVTMSDGTTKDVAVTWGAVDTSKAGTVTVEGTVEGTDKKASVKVVVEALGVDSVTVNNTAADAELTVGSATDATLTLTAAAKNSKGEAIEGKTATWTSSDDKVATVDATGKVTAVAAGTAKITAAVDGKTAAVDVTVKATPDTTAPTFTATAGATNYEFTVSFSEAVKAKTGVTPAVAVSAASTSYNGTLELAADSLSAKVTLSNNAAMTNDTEYTIAISGIQDLADNDLVATAKVTPKDSVAPTIVSTKALDSSHVEVVFSEKIDTATAINTNFTLLEKGLTSDFLTGTSGSETVPLVLPDQKTVRLTLYSSKFLVGGKTYVLSVNDDVTVTGKTSTLADLSTKKAPKGFFQELTGTFDTDTTPPVLLKSSYVNADGILTLTFNEPMSATYDISKISIKGSNGTSASLTSGSSASKDGNIYTVTLSSADKTAVNALPAPLTVSLAAGAFKDASSNNNTALADASVALTTKPSLKTSAYDSKTNTLTLTFDEKVKASSANIDKTKISLSSDQVTTPVVLGSGDVIMTTADSDTIQILLSSTNATSFESIGGTSVTAHTNPVVKLTAGAFQSLAGQQSSATATAGTGLTVTYDNDKPVLTGAAFDEKSSKLVLTFNKVVDKSKATDTSINVYFGSNSLGSMTGLTAEETYPQNKLTYALTTTTDVKTVDELQAKFREITAGKNTYGTDADHKFYVALAANGVKDVNGLGNDALATKTTEMTYTDNVGASFTAAASDKRSVTVTFSEVVTKETAENIANYSVYRTAYPDSTSLKMNVVSATLNQDSGDATGFGKKVVLLFSNDQAASESYTVKVNNVKDQSGNVVESTNNANTAAFIGSSTTPVGASLLTAKIVDTNANNQFDVSDKVELTFDKPVTIKSGQTLVAGDFTFGSNGTDNTTANFGTNPTFVVSSTNPNVLVASINDAPTNAGVLEGAKLDIATSGLAKIIDANNTAAKDVAAIALSTPAGAPSISSVVFNDVDNNGTVSKGDTLSVKFSEPLTLNNTVLTAGTHYDATTNKPKAALFTTSNGGELPATSTVATDIKYDATTPVYSDTLTITLDTAASLTPKDFADGDKFKIAVTKGLKDKWGLTLADSSETAFTSPTGSTSGPKLTGIEYVDLETAGMSDKDKLIFAFDKPVYVDSTVNGAAINAAFSFVNTSATGATVLQEDPKKVSITLNGKDSFIPNISYGNVTTNYAGKLFTDAYGNNIQPAATPGVKIVAASTTNKPKVVSAEFISDKVIKTVWDRQVSYTASPAAGDILGPWDSNTETVSVDTNDITGKTLVITSTTSAPISNVTNGVTGGLTLAAGVFTDAYGGTNAAYDGGTGNEAKINVAKDNTTPAPEATDIANLYFDGVNNKVVATDNVTINNANYGVEAGVLQVYIGSDTPTAASVPTGMKDVTSGTQGAGDVITTGLTGHSAGEKVFYRFSDRAGNTSDWVQDGIIPYAPTAAAIKVGAGNAVNYISNASKTAPVVSVTSSTSSAATDLLFATVTDSAPTTITNTGGTGVVVATAGSAKDVTLASAAGLIDGSALTVKAYAKDAGGNVSTTFTGTVGTADFTAPAYASAALAVNDKDLTLTFTEATATAITNALADAAALKAAVTFAPDGSSFAALGASDTVSISGKTLVINFNSALTTATNKVRINADALKDDAGNKIILSTTGAIDATSN